MTTYDGPCFRCKGEREHSRMPSLVEFKRLNRSGMVTYRDVYFKMVDHYFCEACEEVMKKLDVEKLKYIRGFIDELILECGTQDA